MAVFIGLVILALSVMILNSCAEEKRDQKSEKKYSVQKKENKDIPKEKTLNKQTIYGFKNQSDDHQDLEGSSEEVLFKGYDKEVFDWMQGEDWIKFQEQVCGYLEKKHLNVTTVTLHPDSQQVIDPYFRYLYFDIDYKTAYSDTLLIRATCDTYKGYLRFEFNIQYGD